MSPFYRPRSNPDGWAVTFQCLDPGTVSAVEVRRFNGLNWEAFVEASGITEFSKSPSRGAPSARGGVGLGGDRDLKSFLIAFSAREPMVEVVACVTARVPADPQGIPASR